RAHEAVDLPCTALNGPRLANPALGLELACFLQQLVAVLQCPGMQSHRVPTNVLRQPGGSSFVLRSHGMPLARPAGRAIDQTPATLGPLLPGVNRAPPDLNAGPSAPAPARRTEHVPPKETGMPTAPARASLRTRSHASKSSDRVCPLHSD